MFVGMRFARRFCMRLARPVELWRRGNGALGCGVVVAYMLADVYVRDKCLYGWPYREEIY
jgi:hypothetical protein